MKSYSVKDLMVPLSEYATVTQDATLYEAVLALEEAQEKFEDKHTRYRHRAILVLDKDCNQKAQILENTCAGLTGDRRQDAFQQTCEDVRDLLGSLT